MVNKQEKSVGNTKQKTLITKEKNAHIPIVGIGASAGSLEAFEAFVQALPEDFGIAYVLIVHLDPSHVSILPEIIQKKTKMMVSQITDNMKIMPDHIYIIPPNRDLAILNGALQLLEVKKFHGANLPIDTFFRLLAQDQRHRGVDKLGETGGNQYLRYRTRRSIVFACLRDGYNHL